MKQLLLQHSLFVNCLGFALVSIPAVSPYGGKYFRFWIIHKDPKACGLPP